MKKETIFIPLFPVFSALTFNAVIKSSFDYYCCCVKGMIYVKCHSIILQIYLYINYITILLFYFIIKQRSEVNISLADSRGWLRIVNVVVLHKFLMHDRREEETDWNLENLANVNVRLYTPLNVNQQFSFHDCAFSLRYAIYRRRRLENLQLELKKDARIFFQTKN